MANTRPYTYICPKDVEVYLLLDGYLDVNSLPQASRIAHQIVLLEGEFERESRTAFRPVLVTEEVHDLEAHRSRYYDFLNDWLITRRPVHLEYGPLIPFSSARGHKLEVYEGADGTISATAPQGQWTDYLATKTPGRTQDYWADLQDKVAYFRKTFLFRRHALMRVTYEYGKPITALSSAYTKADATVSVTSTWNYQTRGLIRIGDNYIWHTGKTATTFTGCTGGQFDTNDIDASSGDEVVEVPDSVRGAFAKRVAAHFLENEVYQARVPEGGSGSSQISQKIRDWKDEWAKFKSYYAPHVVF